MKKIIFKTLLYSLIFLILFSVAGAAETVPSDKDESFLSVSGIEEENATVYAYRIIKPVYNDYGVTGYVQTEESKVFSNISGYASVSDTDEKTITESNVSTLAAKIVSGELVCSEKVLLTRRENGTYVADGRNGSDKVYAGMYLVLVSGGSAGNIYNPMVISNFYADAMDAESLGKTGSLVIGVNGPDHYMSLPGRAYAKKDTIPLSKYIVDASVNHNNGKLSYSKYDDAAAGDTLCFDIMTVIPDYSDIYFAEDKDFVFRLFDTQSKGLTVVKDEDIKIYCGYSSETDPEDIALDIVKAENLLDVANYKTETGTNEDGTNYFSIDFSKKFITSADNAGKKLVVRYQSMLDSDAVTGLEGNPNDVRLDYTNIPGEIWNRYDGTTHYTFPLIIAKIDEKGGVEGYETALDTEDVNLAEKLYMPVSGAKFKLTRKEDRNGRCEETVYLMTSDSEGILRFDDDEKPALDEGLYSLFEYEAPKGYALNDKIYEVSITAEYEQGRMYMASKGKNEGEMTDDEHKFIINYKISISDGTGNSAESVFAWDTTDNEKKQVIFTPTAIPNVKLSRLPSAGGVGIYVFCILGFVLMAGATLVILRNKRRNNEKAGQ